MLPEYAPGRAARAIVLARLGKRAEAHAEAARARKCSDHCSVTYQVACVYAVTSGAAEGQAADRKAAFALLRQAIRDGFQDVKRMETDQDLETLRKLPEFGKLVEAVKELAR
jgi:hypothetical protein